MMADMRPVTTSMSEVLFGLTGAPGGGHGGRPAAPAVVNPVEVWTGLPWTPQAISGWLEFAKMMLPTFLLCGFGYAPANACGAFILGSTMRGLGTVGKDILGVQTPMEKMGKARKKGRCADTLPPAPPPRRSRRRCRARTRRAASTGRAPAADQFPPRGAVLTGKSTAAKSAALWPNAWSPSSPRGRSAATSTSRPTRRRRRRTRSATAEELAKSKLEARAGAKDRWGNMKEKMTGFKTQVDWGLCV